MLQTHHLLYVSNVYAVGTATICMFVCQIIYNVICIHLLCAFTLFMCVLMFEVHLLFMS